MNNSKLKSSCGFIGTNKDWCQLQTEGTNFTCDYIAKTAYPGTCILDNTSYPTTITPTPTPTPSKTYHCLTTTYTTPPGNNVCSWDGKPLGREQTRNYIQRYLDEVLSGSPGPINSIEDVSCAPYSYSCAIAGDMDKGFGIDDYAVACGFQTVTTESPILTKEKALDQLKTHITDCGNVHCGGKVGGPNPYPAANWCEPGGVAEDYGKNCFAGKPFVLVPGATCPTRPPRPTPSLAVGFPI
jgi:hypothetical protein